MQGDYPEVGDSKL